MLDITDPTWHLSLLRQESFSSDSKTRLQHILSLLMCKVVNTMEDKMANKTVPDLRELTSCSSQSSGSQSVVPGSTASAHLGAC